MEETRMDARKRRSSDLDRLPVQADVAQLVERRLPKMTEARSQRGIEYQGIRTTMRVSAIPGEPTARAENAPSGALVASNVAGWAA